MFRFAKSLFVAMLFVGATSHISSAATVGFQVNTAGSSVSISNCDDLLCPANVSLAPIAGNPIVNVTPGGPATVFDFLRFTPVIDAFGPDSFDISATLAFSNAGGFSFGTGGEGTNFTTVFNPAFTQVFPFITLVGRFTSGTLVWDTIAPRQIPGIGLVTVAFLNSPVGAFGDGSAPNPRAVITQASISVVPLPGGILLLGSAMLGIFGLSRRRNRKPAAA